MIKLAKKLKKEKVNIDIVNFGEDECNGDVLSKFISTINGKEGTGSHLVTIPPGPHLSDALVTSPVVQVGHHHVQGDVQHHGCQGEEGSGGVGGSSGSAFEFGVNPEEDPELALALRVSMEEQRVRQQEQEQGEWAELATPAGVGGATEESSEEALLQRALAMSMDTEENTGNKEPDLANMSEEEQIAYAMQVLPSAQVKLREQVKIT